MHEEPEATLRLLMERIRQNPVDDPGRPQAIYHLIAILQTLPGLYRWHHQDYYDALDYTWDWLERKISTFEERPPSLADSLIGWVNAQIKWRLHDVQKNRQYRPDGISMDQSLGSEETFSTYGDLKAENRFGIPTLSGLDAYIEQAQSEHTATVAHYLHTYILDDPDGILRQYRLREKPACNFQFLLQRLYLQDPPDTIAAIARELGIRQQSVYSLHRRKWGEVQTHLKTVLLDRGFEPD
jgi:hypothetical protein